MDNEALKHILEAGLLVAGRAMSLSQLDALFEGDADKPDRKMLRAALDTLQQDYVGRGVELVEVASGFRLQSRAAMEPWISRLFPERAPRYSRALLETLVLIAYRQPITRGEIEEVRGVAVSSTIVKTLQEREWVKVIGHKEVPGRPALLATTREFLDYFNLKRLEDLPPLSDLKDLDQFDPQLAEEIGMVSPAMQGDAANDGADIHGPPAPAWARQAPAGSPAADSDTSPKAADARGEDDSGSDETVDKSGDDEPEARVPAQHTGPGPDADMPAAEGQADPDAQPPQGSSMAQTELQRVIAQFASEHRQQLDQQRADAVGGQMEENAEAESDAAGHVIELAESDTEALPAEDLPADDLSAEALPADDLPAEELPASELPADHLPADGLPADDRDGGGPAGAESEDHSGDGEHQEPGANSATRHHDPDRPQPGDTLH